MKTSEYIKVTRYSFTDNTKTIHPINSVFVVSEHTGADLIEPRRCRVWTDAGPLLESKEELNIKRVSSDF